MPYPSYEDPDEKIARALKAPSNFPVTLFVDANGKTVFTHQGGYRTARRPRRRHRPVPRVDA